MAGCEEWANVEEVPSMVGKEGSEQPLNGKELVASSFLERCLAKDGQETSVDLGDFLTPKMGKAKLMAVEALDGERKLFSGAAAETAIAKIQAEKMDKAEHAAVKVPGGDKRRFSIIPKRASVEAGKAAAAMDKIQTEKVHKSAASEQAAGVNGKQRLPDEYVSVILAMPREKPLDTDVEMPFMTEERSQQHKEGAARSERIYSNFVQFQNRVRDELLEKGYVEVEDDYLTNIAESEKEDRELWEESKKKRNPILTFAARDDPHYADFYAPFDPVKQVRSLLSEVN